MYQLFALQQPMASDLRTMLAVLRILHEIELTAGLMRNVARATRRLYPRELPPRIRGIIERMGAQASVQTHLAVDAFADERRRRRVRAARHGRRDGRPPKGAVPRDLRRLLGRPVDEAALQMAVQLAFVGRDYERAADHAVMIGRWVAFMVTGRAARATPTPRPSVLESHRLFRRGSPLVHVERGLAIHVVVRTLARRTPVQPVTHPKGASP